MSSRSLRRSRRKLGVAAITAASLGLAGLGLAASPAQALPNFEFERLAGDDRIETAVDISSSTFQASDTALIARADLYPDALAGNYLAGVEQAPILLSHTGDVPAETMAELDRLGVTSVTLLGGTEALSAAVQAELEAAGIAVDREAGVDRYETAAEIAMTQDPAAIGTVDGQRTAILATGENFPDALTGGPLAYAGNHPILLTPSAMLGDDAQTALEALGIEHVLILGGVNAVSGTVETELTAMGISSQRLAGDTRYDTATDIAEFALTQGFTDAHINVATGQKFPDALTGGPHAGEELTPIILANEGNTAEACAYLTDHADTLANGHIYGGVLAVSAAAEATLEACAQDIATNQAFVVTVGGEDVVIEETDTRDFTFTGIEADEVVIALAECDNVTDTDGTISFVQDEAVTTQTVADFGDVSATISMINGVAVTTPGQTATATVTDGTVEFTVQGADVAECYVAVVFADADEDNLLDIDADGLPTELFGIGGVTLLATVDALDAAPETALNPYATQHTITAQLVTDDADADGDVIVAPYAGQDVQFVLYRGATATVVDGETTDCADGTVVGITTVQTDANGTATFAYTGPADPQANASNTTVDCVLVRADLNGDADFGDAGEADWVSKTWTDAPATATTLDATPEQDTNQIGTNHTVTATVVDQFGNPVEGATVRFEIDRDLEDAGSTDPAQFVFTRTTNTSGVATLTYQGPAESATDVIATCVGTGITGGACDAETNALADDVAKFWVEVATTDATAADVFDADAAADLVFADDGESLFSYDYATGEVYTVDGTAVTMSQFEQELIRALLAGETIVLNTNGYNNPAVTTAFHITTDAASGDTDAPAIQSVTESGNVLTITYDEGVNIIGTADQFEVLEDGGVCGTDTPLVVGTATGSDDGDEVITVTMQTTPELSAGTTAYELCFEAAVVEDAAGNANDAGQFGFGGAA